MVRVRQRPAKSIQPERARFRPTFGLFSTSRLNAYAGISTAALGNQLMQIKRRQLQRKVDDAWVMREPYEVVVVRVATKVRCTECKTVVSARVDHPAEADVQCAEAKLSVAEQVEDGSLLRLRCRLLLGHHRGDHVVHFPLVENHLVSLGHLLDLLLCLTILTLEIFGSPRLSQYNPGRHL